MNKTFGRKRGLKGEREGGGIGRKGRGREWEGGGALTTGFTLTPRHVRGAADAHTGCKT